MNLFKQLIIVILLTTGVFAAETCEYKASPSTFVNTDNNGQTVYFKLYPNELSGSQRIAYVNIQFDGSSSSNRGQITLYVNGSRVNISKSKSLTNSVSNYKYPVGESKSFNLYFPFNGADSTDIKLWHTTLPGRVNAYKYWTIKKECTQSKPADLTVSGTRVVYESGISYTHPKGKFKGYATITNLGDDKSPSSSMVDYYLSTNNSITTTDTKLGDDRIGEITSDKTFNEWLDIPSNISTGTYYYGACTRSFTGEGNRNNNCSSAKQIIIKKALDVSNVASELVKNSNYYLDIQNNMSNKYVKADLYKNGSFIENIISSTNLSRRVFQIQDAPVGSNYYIRVTSKDDSSIYAETNKFSIKVNTPKITSVTPLIANLNEKTIFTVQGEYLPSTIQFYIDECKDILVLGGSETSKRFSCIPSEKGGLHNALVKDKPNGITLDDFKVNFIDNRPTNQLQVIVKDIGGASGQVSSSPSGITTCRADNQGTCQAGFKEDSVIITAHTDDNSKVEFPSACTKIEGNECTVPILDDNVINVKFTPIEKRLKIKFDSTPQNLELNPNEKISINFKVTNSPSDDNIVDKLQIDKYGDSSNVIDCKANFNMKDVVTCEVFYPVVGDYTLTATAYDNTMTSNRLSLPIKVTNGVSRDKFTGHQNPEHLKKFWTNNPQTSKEAFYVDTATGTQNLQLNFLQQFGQIDLNLGITYNSGLAKDSSLGHLGKGWGHSYGMLARVEKINNSRVILHWSDTQQTLFIKGNDGIYRSRTQYVLANYYDELTVTADGYELKKNSLTKYKFNTNGQLVQIINSKGEKLFLTYNTDNRLFQILEPISGIRLKYYYNSDGSIDHVKDVAGHTIAFKYDSSHRLFEITDADETVHSFSYNDYGELISYYIDKGSENFRYFTNTFDELGRVTTQTTKANHVTKFDYNEEFANTIITTVTTPRGNTRKYKYNSTFQLLKYFDELNNLTENTYTDAGLLHTTTDAKDFVTEYFYNDYGKLEKTLYPNGGHEARGYTDGGAGHIDTIRDESIYTIKKYHYEGDLVKKIELNVNNNVKSILFNTYTYEDYTNPDATTTKIVKSIVSTTAKGNKTTTVYEKGRVKSVTNEEGIKTVYMYNKVGNVIEKTLYDKSNSFVGTTKFEYDLKGRVIKVTDAEGNAVSKTYSVFGGTKIVTDAKGNKSENFYDLEGNVVKEKDAKGNFSYFNHNEEGQVLDSTDAEGNKHYISYDVKGRKAFEFNSAKQRIAEYDYDSLDAIKRVYAYDDNNQKVLMSEHSYDIPNRTTTTKSYLGVMPREVTQTFDTRGRLVKNLNSARKEKLFSYENHFNTLTSVKNEMLETASQTVDNEGVLATLTDINTNTTNFEHDSTPNKTKETSALGKVHSSTYNAHQLLKSYTNARGQKQELTYYKNGWLKTLKVEGITWTYAYDANGNVLSIIGSDGSRITRTYDELNRVITYTDTLGQTQSYTYDKVSNLKTLTYPDGKVVSYEYDTENRMKSVTFDGKKIVDYSYTRAGKLKTEAWANGITRTYVYHNGVGELLTVTDRKVDNTIVLSFAYEYDALGNIVKETKTLKGETEVYNYSYNDNSELQNFKVASDNKLHYSAFESTMTNEKDNRIKTIDGQSVQYDADGNMKEYSVNSQERRLSFDALGRLTQANDVVHEYDIENSKIKTINNGKTTNFTVNPNAKLSQLLMETLPNADKVYHIYGIGLVATIKDAQTSYYHFDYRGSTVALSSESGVVTDTYKYLPYGSVAHHNGTSKTRFLYVGKYGIEKEASGLYYMRARYYDADLKRFVSKDTLVGSIENSKSLNRYAYVEGNPVMGIDPRGKMLNLISMVLRETKNIYKQKGIYNSKGKGFKFNKQGEKIDFYWGKNVLQKGDFNHGHIVYKSGFSYIRDQRGEVIYSNSRRYRVNKIIPYMNKIGFKISSKILSRVSPPLSAYETYQDMKMFAKTTTLASVYIGTSTPLQISYDIERLNYIDSKSQEYDLLMNISYAQQLEAEMLNDGINIDSSVVYDYVLSEEFQQEMKHKDETRMNAINLLME